MRKLVTAVGAFVFISAGATAAQANYGMAGCGLGSLLFGDDNSQMMQILAATTNGTFGSQTFGITSGTSNCVQGGAVAANREQIAFAEVNFQDLKRNMATGGGEYINTFATLLGCTDKARPEFAKMTQSKFEQLYPSGDTSPVQMLQTVKMEISGTPALADSCSDERAIARAEGKPFQVASK